MQITGLLLKAKIGRYLMRNGGGLDANIHIMPNGMNSPRGGKFKLNLLPRCLVVKIIVVKHRFV